MTAVIAFPFAIGPNGVAVTVDDTSDTWIEQQIHVVIGTHLGERLLAPLFGVVDPTFSSLDPGQIQTVFDDHYAPHGINVTITEVTSTPTSASSASTMVSWRRALADDDVIG